MYTIKLFLFFLQQFFYFILGLESLPLSPASQFQSNQPKANAFDQFIYTQSQCSHGPNLGGNGLLENSIPQLQTVYGVPNQPFDVQASSFEIAQNAPAQDLLTSYGPPASGSASSIDALVNTQEIHEPSSSYGPPPSGNPGDSSAHGSQKSLFSIQIDSKNTTLNATESNQYDQLPGLDNSGIDGLNIISAQKSHTVEIPIQGQLGRYALQIQAADPLASQNNELETPDHEKFLTEGLLQSILSAIEQPKSNNGPQLEQSNSESIHNHPEIKEFVSSASGQETLLAEVKAE